MLEQIQVQSKFWRERQRVIREQMIPYQWNVINDLQSVNIASTNTGGDGDAQDTDKSYVVENFLIAAGKKQGKRGGMVFQDSDAYKWLEAVAYSLECYPDPKLQAQADSLVQIIADAQESDGYLNTYFQVNEPDRKYQSLYMSHELYCAGHFIEAAVAYYQVTKNQLVLDVAKRLADNIDAHFGPEDGKIHGGDGHEEIELALLRLYELTGEQKYLDLSKYFLLIRGQDPDFFEAQKRRDVALGRKSLIQGLDIMYSEFTPAYFQNDLPLDQQPDAKGHAVRVVYLSSALALGAALSGDAKLQQAAKNYWQSIVERRMYLTGAIGSTCHGEAFTADYDLPNDSMYGETCASVGLTFFARNMLRSDHQGVYGDVMEQALYNTVLAGMSLDGKSYFYVNPLEARPQYSKQNPGLKHVLTRRAGWFACACCPPNLARMVMSVGHYAYHCDQNTIYADLYMESEAQFAFAERKLQIKQSTAYPWDGKITFNVKADQQGPEVKLALRLPEWCESYDLKLNGKEQQVTANAGYLYLDSGLADGDCIELDLHMSAQIVEANPLIAADYGKQAVVRGPMVYCVESCDNGENLQCLHLGANDELQGHFDEQLLDGVYVLESKGCRRVFDFKPGRLYRAVNKSAAEQFRPQTLVLIPYYAWCNRAEGEMRVWLNPKPL